MNYLEISLKSLNDSRMFMIVDDAEAQHAHEACVQAINGSAPAAVFTVAGVVVAIHAEDFTGSVFTPSRVTAPVIAALKTKDPAYKDSDFSVQKFLGKV